MKKGFLINVTTKEITEVEVGDFRSIQKIIGCDLFDIVNIDHKNDLYVDDEGLLSVDKETKFFGFKNSNIRLAGNGLVLGINQNTGNSVNATITLETLKDRVVFYNFDESKEYLMRVGML